MAGRWGKAVTAHAHWRPGHPATRGAGGMGGGLVQDPLARAGAPPGKVGTHTASWWEYSQPGGIGAPEPELLSTGTSCISPRGHRSLCLAGPSGWCAPACVLSSRTLPAVPGETPPARQHPTLPDCGGVPWGQAAVVGGAVWHSNSFTQDVLGTTLVRQTR